MRLLLAGGGTGGHLFPAVALAQELKTEEPAAELLFVGTARGVEAKVLPELGYSLEKIDMEGFVGKPVLKKLGVFLMLMRSVGQSIRILKRFQPQVVVGVGGYASAPVLLAARFMGKPVLIHEQNAVPGLANRLLGRLAQRICLSFEDEQKFFPVGKTLLSGNPVRRGIVGCPPPEGEPVLLIFGGSQGAAAINRAMIEALPLLERWRDRLAIIHQTGAQDEDQVRRAYEDAGWRKFRVASFITDMSAAYAAAHLVVCRAGATTIAELCGCGRTALFIPLPRAAGDHQTRNAEALEGRGAALLLKQKDLTPAKLAAEIAALLDHPQRLKTMAQAMRALGKPEAARLVLRECRLLAGERGN
jgi:UDP-N-acetylglucosamine--N-acetylmuramyl-(pentapeptide) pyrophosphoryl-undecaprenol N-acetylglucosamine transferase